ncbi:nitroreductase family deazaflavin-dependent oxidoreductase [Microbacterium candidum]|uniref:Nitroreductase family deazaflavin-dependent oxidoreductase n=1 Tax=Microbacterium candidum TaxID=3041922 RepID=A0ABT7MTN5_9MICO|nr:nitroreductase family deazaflavin-dependent oxidoreductase [Microbacterium sp. ASV49]MDL9977806.1 nitroreductase family deazaflavin-dependent oxidoreductase [Microbacterium sp. ASV49]
MDVSGLVVLVVAAHVALAALVTAIVIHRRRGLAVHGGHSFGTTASGGQVPAHTGPHGGHAHGVLAFVSRSVAALVGFGVRLGPVRLLTVRGRSSGLPRSTPVDVFTGRDGAFWLVATHTANAQWVRNLRAAGEGRLSRGRDQFAFSARELDAADGAAVLAEIVAPRLARPWGGLVLRRTLGLPTRPDAAQFAAAVAEHPVFALAPHPEPDAVAEAVRDRTLVPRHLIGIGIVVAFVHALAGAAGILGPAGWMSGVALGLLVAGLGNHLRLAARAA